MIATLPMLHKATRKASVATKVSLIEDRKTLPMLRVTPAMAAGVTDRLWEMKDVVEMIEAFEVARERAPQSN